MPVDQQHGIRGRVAWNDGWPRDGGRVKRTVGWMIKILGDKSSPSDRMEEDRWIALQEDIDVKRKENKDRPPPIHSSPICQSFRVTRKQEKRTLSSMCIFVPLEITSPRDWFSIIGGGTNTMPANFQQAIKRRSHLLPFVLLVDFISLSQSISYTRREVQR